ncbi:MAG: non-hydrolyzing UDP-N-acetylglucosamine 2-epimerase [Candidatus Binatia bacterium]
MRILHVAGARPNFMKVAPVRRALACYDSVHQTLVHTGQHYDANMSDIFFRHLGMPQPDVNLAVGSGSHAWQTAEIMSRFEPVVLERKPDLVLVYGDVNSTLAAALVCAKLFVPVGHVEAGLRCFDRTMPEEVNRLVTDQIADLLFTSSVDGDQNLLREGVASERIHLVGNVMIDTLARLLPRALTRWPVQCLGTALPVLRTSDECEREGLAVKRYGLVTLHRPSNIDNATLLARIMEGLIDISRDLPLIFPIHPRLRPRLGDWQFAIHNSQLHCVDPLGYLDFLALQRHATVVITDSGGIQEETTYLGIPCLTVRERTERPVTTILGTNTLVGHDMERLQIEVRRTLAGDGKQGQIPPLWDGHAAERIAHMILT